MPGHRSSDMENQDQNQFAMDQSPSNESSEVLFGTSLDNAEAKYKFTPRFRKISHDPKARSLLIQAATASFRAKFLGPAFIYACSLANTKDYVKIGYTSNVQQYLSRLVGKTGRQYDLMFAIKVPKLAQRVERLVHVQFRDRQYSLNLPDLPEPAATQGEWFKISVQEAKTSVLKWVAWMDTEPYQMSLPREQQFADDKGTMTRGSKKLGVAFELKQSAVPSLEKVVDAVLHGDTQSPLLHNVAIQQPSDRSKHHTNPSTTLSDSSSYLVRKLPLLSSSLSITEGSTTAAESCSDNLSGTTLVENRENDTNEERLVSLLLQYENVQELSLRGADSIGLDRFRNQLQPLIDVFGRNVVKEAKLPKNKIAASWICNNSQYLTSHFRGRLQCIKIETAIKADPEMSVNEKLALRKSRSNEQLAGQRIEADLEISQTEVNEPSLDPHLLSPKEGQTSEQLEFEEMRVFLMQTRAIQQFHEQLSDTVDLDMKSAFHGSASETSGGQLFQKILWPVRDELDRILTVRGQKFQILMSDLRLIIKRGLRPNVIPGYQRIEWTCTCGAHLYRFFESGLEIPIHYPYNLDSNPLTLGSSQSGSGRLERRMTTSGIDLQPNHCPNPNPITPLNHRSNQVASLGSGSQDGSRRRFLELCIDTGKYIISLGELDVSNIRSDSELFVFIHRKYRELRGSIFQRMFSQPIDIHFVKFNLERYYRVGIRGKPVDLPPEEEIRQRRYEYMTDFLPPMDRKQFLHHFYHSDQYTGCFTFFHRLPKKLDHPLCTIQTPEGTRGWGIHIIEGTNWASLTWCCVIIEVFSFLVSVIYAVLAKTEEQGFGIGSWMVAVLTTTLSALYMQFQDYQEQERW